ncbi:MAG: LEA type 2 family protein [Myxococcota bacterium]
MRVLPWLVVMSGCKELGSMKDLKDLLPEVHFDELKIEKVDFQGLDAKFVIDVTNPYPVELNLAETSWKLGLAGSPFLDGTNEHGVSIAAAETSKTRIPFSLKFADAFSVVTGAKGQDQLPFVLDADLGFDSPVGRVNVPLHREGDLPALHAPKLSLDGLRIEKLDLMKQTATLALDVGMKSEQGSALTFESFTYGIKLAGNDVASGTASIGALGATQDSRNVTLPVELKLLGLAGAVVEAVTKKSQVKVRLTGDASIGTPFGAIPFGFDEIADLTPK